MAAPMKTCRRFLSPVCQLSSKFTNAQFYCKNQTENVRVRFAPSPTGMLHLGGLRTALYNYLFARSKNGSFILRIEDTDQTRYVADAEKKIEEDLEWCGINPHEGPSSGGNFGPYMQSQRLDLYQEEVLKLIKNGSAYYCFCSSKRLELLRKDAARRGETPKYDNRCRHLTTTEVEEKLARKNGFVIRLKMELSEEPFDDMIKGPIVHNVADIEGDPVLMKSDKFPTYHFANVVDDHHMKISHVFRGEEWQASTPKHIILYKAFNWTPPRFAHLPLILNKDGTKLSKRQGDIHVEYFKNAGYFSEALINYITKVGGGFGTDDVYGLSLSQLTNMFKVSGIRRQNGRLDPDWLEEANRIHLVRKIQTHEKTDLIKKMRKVVKETLRDKTDQCLYMEDEYVGRVLDWSISEGRITKLRDLMGPKYLFLWSIPSDSQIESITQIDNDVSTILTNCVARLNNINNFTILCVGEVLKGHLKDETITMKIYMKIIRLALSGLKDGPPVAEMMSIIGKENTIHRLKNTLNILKNR